MNPMTTTPLMRLCPGCDQDVQISEFPEDDYLCYSCRNKMPIIDTVMERALAQMNAGYDQWTLRRCQGDGSMWWEAEGGDGLKIRRAKLSQVVSIARMLNGEDPIPEPQTDDPVHG
jgi:hypothetical protein